jgi:uncharacterized protein
MNSSRTLPIRNDPASRPEAIAPVWHTVIVLAALFGMSLLGALKGNMPGIGQHGRIPGYCLVMVIEWALVAFIWYALRRRGVRMSDLIAGRWERPRQIFRDLGIAVAFVLVCGMGLLGALGYVLKAAPDAALRNLFPHGAAEIGVYLMLTATAGFCEELIFRGYLQRQFAALTRSLAGGIVLQGIAFGASHGYQGWKFMLMITVFGIAFGLLAIWRRSLRPGMMAHFLQDTIGGLLGPHLP